MNRYLLVKVESGAQNLNGVTERIIMTPHVSHVQLLPVSEGEKIAKSVYSNGKSKFTTGDRQILLGFTDVLESVASYLTVGFNLIFLLIYGRCYGQ